MSRAVNGDVTPGRIAILGAGKIGEALVAGLVSSGWRAGEQIVVTARAAGRIEELCDRYGISGTLSNLDAIEGADIVVIAVKPQDIGDLLAEIGGRLTSSQTVLSVAAAIPTAEIERHCADTVPVVRAMPNTASTVHEGMAGLAPGAHASEDHMRHAEELLAHVGRTVRVSALHGRGDGGLRLRAGLLRAPGRVDDRGGHPARALPRDLDGPRRPDDARNGQAPA